MEGEKELEKEMEGEKEREHDEEKESDEAEEWTLNEEEDEEEDEDEEDPEGAALAWQEGSGEDKLGLPIMHWEALSLRIAELEKQDVGKQTKTKVCGRHVKFGSYVGVSYVDVVLNRDVV